VLFASRFAEAWRQDPAPEPTNTDWPDMPGYDDDLSGYPTLETEPDEPQLYTDPDGFEFEWEPEPEPDRALVHLNGQSSLNELDDTNPTTGHTPEATDRRPGWLPRRSPRARPTADR
jgi:hypothetical protein